MEEEEFRCQVAIIKTFFSNEAVSEIVNLTPKTELEKLPTLLGSAYMNLNNYGNYTELLLPREVLFFFFFFLMFHPIDLAYRDH